MKNLFIHIGTSKTGSNSLQKALFENKTKLENASFLYPTPTRLNHTGLLNGESWSDFIDARTWKSFEGSAIISSEIFFRKSPNDIPGLLEAAKNCTVTVIVYLRRQDLWLESQFTQSVKTSNHLSDLQSFLGQKRLFTDYWAMLEPWAQCFGKENIIVRPLEKQQIPDTVEDFLNTIGYKGEKFEEPKFNNEKPSLFQLRCLIGFSTMMKKKFNIEDNRLHGHLQEKAKVFFKTLLQDTDEHDSQKNYKILSYKIALRILKAAEESNKKVAINYLGRENGQLFLEKISDYEHDSLSMKHFSEAEIGVFNEQLLNAYFENMTGTIRRVPQRRKAR